MRALLIGFGPFPGAPVNPSGLLVRALARRRRPALAGIARSAHVLTTSYAAVDRDLPKLFAARPDVVLMFGVAGRRHEVCIEMRARNAMSLVFPDAAGWRPARSAIARHGPPALGGRAPFSHLLGALRAARVPSRLSRGAGAYLCNYLYWRALQRADSGARPLVQFVHVPALRIKPSPRRHRPRRPLSLAQLVRGGEAVLIALAAASKH